MDAIPRDYEARCLFDAFCKTVLRNEAKSYLAEMKRRRDREVSLSSLSQADLDKLCTVEHYPGDRHPLLVARRLLGLDVVFQINPQGNSFTLFQAWSRVF